MAKRPSTGRKLTGIYSRGKTFWFTYRLNGKKYYASLGTDDYGEAVKRALEIRQKPELAPAAVFAAEIAAFIAHKIARNEYSPDSAAVKVHILEELAETVGKPNPTRVTTGDVTNLYRRLQARVAESTAQGYLVTVRSFFNWLVAAGKMRTNPVVGVQIDRLDLKGRDSFAPRPCGTSSSPGVRVVQRHYALRRGTTPSSLRTMGTSRRRSAEWRPPPLSSVGNC